MTFLNIFKDLFVCLFTCYVYMSAHTCHNTHVDIEGQVLGVGSLLSPVGPEVKLRLLDLVASIFTY